MSALTIVIVNYNSTDFLKRCVDSVFTNTALDSFGVVVVDNASSDRDFSEIRLLHPEVRFLLNEDNRGFAKACNQGIRDRPAENYLLLNPDCLVKPHTIDKCLEFLTRNSEIGILGCRVCNSDGSLQLACRRQIPRPSTAFYRFSGLSRVFPNSRRFAAYNLSHLDEHQNHKVGAVSGSFLMFRHQVYLDTGGLDERFFLYGEDLDFCYRTALKGWQVFYFAGAEVTHFKNMSSRRGAKQSTRHFFEAMETFYRKHFFVEAGRLEKILVPAAIRLLYLCKRMDQILFHRSEIGSRR